MRYRHYGPSLQALNERGIPTARGGKWSAVQVQRVLDRQAALA
jgi:hypothetical protein